MQTGSARIFWTLAVSCVVGCSPPEPAATAATAAAPAPSDAQRDRQIAREQRSLNRRLQKLEKRALSELRKLRESRQASTGAAEPARDDDAVAPADYELMILGGAKHEVFLGCLCDEKRPDSVFNMLGEHGSHSSSTSIRNKFAPYGSNHDDTSACNAAAGHPPVIMSSDGKSLGLLTLNPSLKRRITSPSVADWLSRMCGE
jgi:hypothetical protein